MNKPRLKLGFRNTFENAQLFFMWALKKRFDVICDHENPDYLIYGDSNFGQFDPNILPNAKKIFYTGEPVGREFAEVVDDSYAITFDHVNSPSHYRLPLYVVDMWAAVHDDKFTDDFLYLCHRDIPDPLINFFGKQTNHRLFSYVQTNPNQHIRTGFVKKLIEREMVDCGGPHLNNVGFVVPREGGHTAKIEFLKRRKFNVAFENGSRLGYVTEKLINAYYANTIPVYWGSMSVEREFNPESFINANNCGSAEEVIDKVMSLNADPQKYKAMLTAPPFRDNIPPSCTNIDLFLDWFETFVYEGE